MNFSEIDKVSLFLFLFLPGFVTLKIYDLMVPSPRRDFSKSLFEVASYGALNFCALSPLIYWIHSNNFPAAHTGWYFGFLALIFLGAPLVWPFVILKVFSLPWIARRITHPIGKPWDYVFGKKLEYWVIVHLKDGKRIGGRFDTDSFVSSEPSKEQIYLQEVWKLDDDGAFLEPIDRTAGILLSEDSIMAVELFSNKELEDQS